MRAVWAIASLVAQRVCMGECSLDFWVQILRRCDRSRGQLSCVSDRRLVFRPHAFPLPPAVFYLFSVVHTSPRTRAVWHRSVPANCASWRRITRKARDGQTLDHDRREGSTSHSPSKKKWKGSERCAGSARRDVWMITEAVTRRR